MVLIPPEILLDILKFSLADRVTIIEPCDAVGRDSYNEVLLKTSLVSRAWADASQYMLFRDIRIGSVTTKDGSNFQETLSATAALNALRRLPDRNHVRSAHLHVGQGFAYHSQPGQPIGPRYSGGRAHISRAIIPLPPIVSLKWMSPNQMADFVHLCPNLHRLAVTVADPTGDVIRSRQLPRFPAVHLSRHHSLFRLQVLSYTFKTESHSVQFGEPVHVLALLLKVAPNIVSLFVDMYSGGGGEHDTIAKLSPVILLRLRELRISGDVPSFIMRGSLPALEVVIWRKPNQAQVNTLPPSIRSLSLGGDLGIPNFDRLPNLRHLLIDGSDILDGSSYWSDSYRTVGIANKTSYILRAITALPRGLESFTILESFSMRLLSRKLLCRTISTALSSKPRHSLPRILKVQRVPGDLPDYFIRREWGSLVPLYESAEFYRIRKISESHGIQIITGEYSDPFSMIA